MTEELKLEIIKVEEEETQDGIPIYKMTLQTDMGIYERAVTVEVWENERDQRSVTKHWLKSIGKIEVAKRIHQSKTKEERKAETKAKIKNIEGTAIEDE